MLCLQHALCVFWGEQETVSVPAHSSEPGTLHNRSIVVLQWIKSVDERGQTYYYLRDGSRSLWTLPEVNGSISGTCVEDARVCR